MKKILLALSAFAVMAFGGDFEDALKADNAGDYEKAVELYKKSAEQGNATAQYNLGNMYNKGQGVKQDYNKAVELWQKVADKGDASAQLNLGNMYKDG